MPFPPAAALHARSLAAEAARDDSGADRNSEI